MGESVSLLSLVFPSVPVWLPPLLGRFPRNPLVREGGEGRGRPDVKLGCDRDLVSPGGLGGPLGELRGARGCAGGVLIREGSGRWPLRAVQGIRPEGSSRTSD